MEAVSVAEGPLEEGLDDEVVEVAGEGEVEGGLGQ
jgi:hypothetical protein